MNVRSVLEDLGYQLASDGEFFRTSALFRGGINRTSLSVRKRDGYTTDFGSNRTYTLEQLISLTLGSDEKGTEIWIKERGGLDKLSISKPKVELKKTYPRAALSKLVKVYKFYNDRGISDETLEIFEGGVALENKLANRFVFPIFDAEGSIVGFAGRDLYGKKVVKWKNIGPKKHFVHPLHLNKEIILEKRQVILVESIGDMLALWEAGIKNVLVIFGLSLQSDLFKNIISLNPEEIIISLNHEPEKGKAGGTEASEKIKKTLLRMFDENVVKVAHPDKNDFGEMSKEEIKEWYSRLIKSE